MDSGDRPFDGTTLGFILWIYFKGIDSVAAVE